MDHSRKMDTEDNQCQREDQFKEHPSEIFFDSVLEMESGNDGVILATAVEGEESRRPRSNRLDPHSDANPAKNIHRPTGQPNAKHRNSGKDRRSLRKHSNRKVKKKNGPRRPTTDQNTDPSHFMTLPRSHLAGRRKFTPQPSQHPSQAISPEQYAHIRCPVPPKSHRKSPVLTPRKVNQSTHASKTPRHVPIQGEHFVFPEISEVPRQSTKKTCVGSEEAYKQNTETSTHGQCEETMQEKNRKATIPSLPKICHTHQRRESRDHVGTSVYAVAPQSPRYSPRSHAARLETLSPLCTSEGESSVLDPNPVPSISVICPTSNPALHQKLKHGMSNTSAAESREKSPKRNGISSQEPRLPSSPIISSNRLNQLSRASKSPRKAMTNNNYFAYPDVRVPRQPTRRICLGSSGTFVARQAGESQRSFSSNGSTQESALSPAVSPNHFSCPAPQKSPRKPPVRTRKNMRSTRAAKTPKSATGKDRHFVYPEITQELRPATTKTLVGTGTMLKEQGEIKPSNHQTVISEKLEETPKQINSSVPSLPKIPNAQPTKQDLKKKREKTLLEICNALSSQKRTV